MLNSCLALVQLMVSRYYIIKINFFDMVGEIFDAHNARIKIFDTNKISLVSKIFSHAS